MIDVSIKIPEELKEFIGETDNTLYVEALKEVARRRLDHIKKSWMISNKRRPNLK